MNIVNDWFVVVGSEAGTNPDNDDRMMENYVTIPLITIFLPNAPYRIASHRTANIILKRTSSVKKGQGTTTTKIPDKITNKYLYKLD